MSTDRPKLSRGDVIKVTHTVPEYLYFKVGDVGTVLDDTGFRVDFKGNKTYYKDGIWSLRRSRSANSWEISYRVDYYDPLVKPLKELGKALVKMWKTN